MQSFPLIKTKLSNERMMAAVFFVVVLYLLPRWVLNPSGIMDFLVILAFGLALDTAIHYLRYERLICAVSASVTAAILYALSPAVPLWGELLAIGAALLLGKHIWGGTGKNPVNPAMVGLLFLGLFFPVTFPLFDPSWLLLPALLLSWPFFLFRPFAAAGMMAGMVGALLLQQTLILSDGLSYGIIFWGCLVITDPVTMTAKPLPGALIGLLAGFLPLFFGHSATAMALGVLTANILSFGIDKFSVTAGVQARLSFKKKKHISYVHGHPLFVDLTKSSTVETVAIEGLTPDIIFKRIERNKVFGFGGAAFPTIKKIKAVQSTDKGEYHLIVNGVECDPGLLHDKWLLHNHVKEILQGIRLLAACIPFRSMTVAVKDTEGLIFPKDIALYKVPDNYPAGAEKILIKEVLKKELSCDAIPATEGILVLNVQTVFAIYEAVCFDRKADTRFITMANMREMSGKVVRVALGTKVQAAVEKIYPGAVCVFSGGGMMNAHITPEDAVVDSSVNFLAVGGFPHYKESPLCSKCGYCNAVCPARLKVNEIARLVDAGKIENTVGLHPERCLSCGSCSYVCLAGRNLSARISAAKASIRNKI